MVAEDQIKNYTQPFLEEMNFEQVVPISAALGTNLPALLEKTMALLPEGPYYYPESDLTDQPQAFIIAELIREKTLLLTRDEVPHSLAVEVEEFNQNDQDKSYVRAVIYTERDSQKGIIIGKNGQMLKNIENNQDWI
jgi:GTP-binding protein Era